MTCSNRSKLVYITSVIGLVATLSSCSKAFNHAPTKRLTGVPSSSTESSQSKLSIDVKIQQNSAPQYEIDLTKVPVENRMADLLQLIKQPEYAEIIQKLLKEKPKFRKMVKTCPPKNLSDRHITLYGAYGEIYPFPSSIDSGLYLVGLKCTTGGRSGNAFRFFTYTDSQGINLAPLKFTLVSVKKNKELNFKDTTDLVASELQYNPRKKELSIATRCNRPDGRMNSLTKYKYVKGRFMVSEFWGDAASNVECIREKTLRRLYP